MAIAPLSPFVADPDFTLHVGDVREVLRDLPDESVDCVVTSPPYWGLRDYGTGEWEGGDAECDHVQAKTGIHRDHSGDIRRKPQHDQEQAYSTISYAYRDICGKCGATRVDHQLGLEPTPEEYVSNMVEVFREVRRVLRRDGTCWLNLGDSYAQGSKGNSGAIRPGDKQGTNAGSLDTRRGDGLGPNRTGGTKGLCKPKDLVGIPWRVAFALQQPYYSGRIKDERERIWLAATVEAEGCLFIHKRKVGQSNGQGYERKSDTYGAGLEVASTDRVVVERCMAITGLGSISEQSPEQNARRKQTIYRWNLRSNVCREVIRELYPHFIAKQHEARLLLGCPSSGEDARKAHESLKAIHQGLEPCIDFQPPEGMWERGWFLRSEIIWAKLCRTQCLNP